MVLHSTWLLVFSGIGFLTLVSLVRAMRRQHAGRVALEQSRQLGFDTPTSLHPRVDRRICLGCAACVGACPETGTLAIVEGQMHLVDARACVGHGECKLVCPVGAIELVLGSPQHPVQVPVVDARLESTIPGLYIAGELGGQGLIHLAMRQGLEAIASLAGADHLAAGGEVLDVAIVGAGPAGLAAALACKARGLRHLVIDQEGLGGSVNQYPRQKLVMTQPVLLPLVGRMYFRHVSKEELLSYWRGVVKQARIEIQAPVRVVDVKRQPQGGFVLHTDAGSVEARQVVLAIGRRGTPRKLGVPGEDSPKVAYRLLEPGQYKGASVLVVGGGNSAVEAATALAEAGGRVTLSYRGRKFRRVAKANLTRLQSFARSELHVETESQLLAIEPRRVRLHGARGDTWIANRQVFVFAGGELPVAFLQRIGLEIATYTGQPERPRAQAVPVRNPAPALILEGST